MGWDHADPARVFGQGGGLGLDGRLDRAQRLISGAQLARRVGVHVELGQFGGDGSGAVAEFGRRDDPIQEACVDGVVGRVDLGQKDGSREVRRRDPLPALFRVIGYPDLWSPAARCQGRSWCSSE
jgi:hypothetical protein